MSSNEPARRWSRGIGRAAVFAVCLVLACGSLAACARDDGKSGATKNPEDPSVPVVASWVVDGGVKESQDVRVAVHGVRQIEGASVLDWSVTPLAAEGQSVGDAVAQSIDVGVEPWMHNGNGLRLVDIDSRKVYRPLDNDDQVAGGQEVVGCLCIPWYRVKDDLTVGTTRMLQVAFPPLPEGITSIAVANQGAPMVGEVPVAGHGQILTGPSTDLTAPVEASDPVTDDAEFTYPIASPLTKAKQRMSVHIDEVLAGTSSTSIRLTVSALEDGGGLDQFAGMPIGDSSLVPHGSMLYENVASGLGVQLSDGVGGTKAIRPWFATVSQKQNLPPSAPDDFTWRECLCSNAVSSGKRLTKKSRSLTLFAQLPAVPSDAETVDVVFPHESLPAFADVPVTRVKRPKGFSFEDVGDLDTWTQGTPADPLEEQAKGWSVDAWPTPIPDTTEIDSSEATVDDLEEVVTDEVSAETKDDGKVEVTLDSTVSFKPDSAKLTSAALKTVRRIAADIDAAELEGGSVVVDGHVAGTDEGSKSFQKRLSQDRADAVVKALKKVVKSDVRFTSAGRGAEEPVAPNDREENRKKNRRVVVTYEQ